MLRFFCLLLSLGHNFKIYFQNGAWGAGPLMKWIAARYNNPDILITENGFLTKDTSYNDVERKFFIQVSNSAIFDSRKIIECI